LGATEGAVLGAALGSLLGVALVSSSAVFAAQANSENTSMSANKNANTFFIFLPPFLIYYVI
jgi:hypothetical protein